MNAPQALHPTDETLHAYGLGNLEGSSADSVEAHLEGCPACRHRVAELSSDSFLGRLRNAQARPETPAPAVSSMTDRSSPAGQRRSPVPSATGTLPPGLVDHPDYEILRELGRGGMGVVYLAENKLMGRKEVLKVVSGQLISRPGVLDRFLREIRSAAGLHHPNIVTAYSALRVGENLVLAMEYVEGFDLSRVVKAKGPLPVAVACNYVHQAALGLQHAHEHGMVHRDIKPSNLILGRQGNRGVVKILDFGLARVEREHGGAGTLTQAGQLLGTPAYMAPEQTSDPRRVDIRADIYSLGCTFYYLLTGNPPFQGANLYDILQAHQSMEALPLNLARPEVPIQLAIVVATMMAKEPDRRFGTPQEVAQALAPFLKKDAAPASGLSLSVFEPPAASRPELLRADGWIAAPPAANVVAAPAPAPSLERPASPKPASLKPVEPRPSGTELETLIEIDQHADFSEEVRAIREARASKAWLWPAAACVLVLLGVAVVVGMRIEAGKSSTTVAQTAPPAPQREKAASPPVAARPSERPVVPQERSSSPPVRPEPATGPSVVVRDDARGSSTPDETPRTPTSRPETEPTAKKKPDLKEEVARNDAKADVEPAAAPGSPEAVLASRGLKKTVEARTVYYVVETEREFARGLPQVRAAINVLEAAYNELAAALQVEYTVKELDLMITGLQFDIRDLNAQMANLPNDAPGRVARQQYALAIQAKQTALGDAQRNIVIAQKQLVKPAKMQELKDEFEKRKTDFKAAAGALLPTYQKLLNDYNVLEKDEEIARMRKLLGERNKVKVQLGPSASVQLAVRRVREVQQSISDDPDAFRTARKSTRLKGRDAPKSKMRKNQ